MPSLPIMVTIVPSEGGCHVTREALLALHQTRAVFGDAPSGGTDHTAIMPHEPERDLMAKSRVYCVSLLPAEVGDRMFRVSLGVAVKNGKDYTVTADSFDKLEAEIRRLAVEDFKQTCAVLCHVPKGERKSARLR